MRADIFDICLKCSVTCRFSAFQVRNKASGLSGPGSGPGKPEALKFDLNGCWSRRIDLAHRLVYQVDEPAGQLIVLQCRYHY